MAPSFQEPLAEALEIPLKKKPDLVAPEPGESVCPMAVLSAVHYTNLALKNTVPVQSPNKQARAMHAQDAQTKPSALLPQRAPTLISPSSRKDWLV